MNINATGQLYGYTLQFPRALLRLLQVDNGAWVGIEVNGDVAVFSTNGSITSEEDKSSLVGNAVADCSKNVWKTFYNWINTIEEKKLNVNRDNFVLYTNHSVPDNSLIKVFSNVSCVKTAQDAFSQAIKVLHHVDEKHKLFIYKDKIFSKSPEVFKSILQRFELIVDQNANDVYESIRLEIRRKAFEEKDIETLLDSLAGWLQKTIMERITTNQTATVTTDELMGQIRILGRKLRGKELIDFASRKMPTQDEIQARANQRPMYVQQLEHINADDDLILESVSDYFKAYSNRQDWIARQFVNDEEMNDFEGRLRSHHKNIVRKTQLLHGEKEEVIRGQIVLNECLDRQETLAGQHPTDRMIQGSYHVLSDEKRVGWHPRWEELIGGDSNGGFDGTIS